MKLYRSSLPWPQHGGSVWIRLTYPVIFKSFTVPSQRMNISEFVKRVYLCLFYTPNGWSSKRCVENLHQWTKRTRKQLSFAINMVWQEQKNHVDDCYFCLTKTSSMACTPPPPPPPPPPTSPGISAEIPTYEVFSHASWELKHFLGKVLKFFA